MYYLRINTLYHFAGYMTLLKSPSLTPIPFSSYLLIVPFSFIPSFHLSFLLTSPPLHPSQPPSPLPTPSPNLWRYIALFLSYSPKVSSFKEPGSKQMAVNRNIVLDECKSQSFWIIELWITLKFIALSIATFRKDYILILE